MKKNKLITIIFVLISSMSLTSFATEEIRWIANDYAPYSYIDKDGNNSGLAVEVASQIMKRIDSKNAAKNIEIKKLSKFFVFRNDDANTTFFPLVKTPKRESRFKWIGPIITPKTILIAKKEKNIKVHNPSDLSRYSIGSISGFYAIPALVELGVNSSAFQSVDNDNENLKELYNGEIDIALCDELSCNFSMKSQNFNANDFEVIYSLKNPEQSFYFAFSTDTKEDVTNKIQQALDNMKLSKDGKTSDYDLIIKKYIK